MTPADHSAIMHHGPPNQIAIVHLRVCAIFHFHLGILSDWWTNRKELLALNASEQVRYFAPLWRVCWRVGEFILVVKSRLSFYRTPGSTLSHTANGKACQSCWPDVSLRTMHILSSPNHSPLACRSRALTHVLRPDLCPGVFARKSLVLQEISNTTFVCSRPAHCASHPQLNVGHVLNAPQRLIGFFPVARGSEKPSLSPNFNAPA